MKAIAIIFDCGATNIRVIAINLKGEIVASESYRNYPDVSWDFKELTWNSKRIWKKFCNASKKITSLIDCSKIVGVAVTTFGVDGTLVNKNGKLLYPIISWECQRTKSNLKNIERKIALEELYKISGVYPHHFNTVFKLDWLQENHPELVEEAHQFLFISSIINHKLTGNLVNDCTMIGTSMLTDHKTQQSSPKIFDALGIDPNIMGNFAKAGDEIGRITEKASKKTGIPKNTRVYSAGHDTQFALIGSGASVNQPVVSSGTWEILMTRSKNCKSTTKELELGITNEFDATKGMYNIGVNYIGSGLLEWVKKNFYTGTSEDVLYDKMIAEASKVEPFCNGVSIDSDFVEGKGNLKGLSLQTTPAQIYRAALESLSFQLKTALKNIEESGNFTSEAIICVGGGSKNHLWNQLKADICNIPVKTIEQKETTVLGAAMCIFKTILNLNTFEEVRDLISYKPQIIYPTKNNKYL